MSQKGKQERVRMQSERWWLLGGNLLTSLSIPLVLSPYTSCCSTLSASLSYIPLLLNYGPILSVCLSLTPSNFPCYPFHQVALVCFVISCTEIIQKVFHYVIR